MPGIDSPSHWLILAIVVAVLFGYKKLPEMSRSVGRSLRIFKTEMKGMNDDDTARDAEVAGVAPAPPAAAVAPVVPVIDASVAPTVIPAAAADPAVVPPVAVPVNTQPTTSNGATVKQMGV